MREDLERELIAPPQVADRVAQLGRQIASDIESQDGPDGADLVIIPILTGSIVFVADLIRQLPIKLRLAMVAVSSYPGQSTESKGAHLASELPRNLRGKHVLVVDDILDSGQTLGLVMDLIAAQQPASLRCAVLLKKPTSRRRREVHADYVGFEIPDEFVVGYGLDFDGYYRNLPSIAVLRPEAANGGGAP